jgi:hypothetical protein
MYQGDAAETERFIRAMDSSGEARRRRAVLYLDDRLDLGGVEDMIDIGGGPATIRSLCRARFSPGRDPRPAGDTEGDRTIRPRANKRPHQAG